MFEVSTLEEGTHMYCACLLEKFIIISDYLDTDLKPSKLALAYQKMYNDIDVEALVKTVELLNI